MGSQNRMKYEMRPFVDRKLASWRSSASSLAMGPAGTKGAAEDRIGLLTAASRCHANQGGRMAVPSIAMKWASAEGDDYFRYARYSQREVPELLVRRFRPRAFVPSLLK